MLILGLILLVIGFVAKIAILWTIGIILLVIGAVLWILGSMGARSVAVGTTGSAAASPVDPLTCWAPSAGGHRPLVNSAIGLRHGR